VRDSSLRRIVSPSRQSSRPVSSGSPLFSTYASRETHFLNHTTTLSRSAERGGPFQALYSGVDTHTQRAARVDSGATSVYTVKDADFRPKNKTFPTILASSRFHNNVETSEKRWWERLRLALLGPAQAAKTVQRALQNIGRRHLVD
jgi:hypothetical protein